MAFKFKLVLEDGTPADLPTFVTAVPDWCEGDEIPLGPGRSLRVIEARVDVLVVTVAWSPLRLGRNSTWRTIVLRRTRN